MAFIDDYYRLRTALNAGKSIPDDVVKDFIVSIEDIATLADTRLQHLDQWCLKQCQDEIQDGNADAAAGLGSVVFPFLAVHLNDLLRGGDTPQLTLFHYQSDKIIHGSELEFLRNHFLEYLFALNTLPLRLRRWFFDQVVKKSHGLPTNIPLVEQSMTERMLTLAQRYAQNDRPAKTETHAILGLVERNDLLTKSLLKEWGLHKNWFDVRVIEQRLGRMFTGSNLRRIRLVLGKYTLMTALVILIVVLLWVTYIEWQLLTQQQDRLVKATAERWQKIAQRLNDKVEQ